ncbi:MAG: (2Fe-2S)-binding protein [Myxococcota bacterium]
MIICSCRGISQNRILETILGGASSIDDLAFACDAGLDCGSCRASLVELLAEFSGQTCPTHKPDNKTCCHLEETLQGAP